MAAAGVARPDLQSRNSGSGPAARPQQPETAAESGGKFVGLALDEVNEDDKTDGRIDAWAAQLKNEGVE